MVLRGEGCMWTVQEKSYLEKIQSDSSKVRVNCDSLSFISLHGCSFCLFCFFCFLPLFLTTWMSLTRSGFLLWTYVGEGGRWKLGGGGRGGGKGLWIKGECWLGGTFYLKFETISGTNVHESWVDPMSETWGLYLRTKYPAPFQSCQFVEPSHSVMTVFDSFTWTGGQRLRGPWVAAELARLETPKSCYWGNLTLLTEVRLPWCPLLWPSLEWQLFIVIWVAITAPLKLSSEALELWLLPQVVSLSTTHCPIDYEQVAVCLGATDWEMMTTSPWSLWG